MWLDNCNGDFQNEVLTKKTLVFAKCNVEDRGVVEE